MRAIRNHDEKQQHKREDMTIFRNLWNYLEDFSVRICFKLHFVDILCTFAAEFLTSSWYKMYMWNAWTICYWKLSSQNTLIIILHYKLIQHVQQWGNLLNTEHGYRSCNCIDVCVLFILKVSLRWRTTIKVLFHVFSSVGMGFVSWFQVLHTFLYIGTKQNKRTKIDWTFITSAYVKATAMLF